MTNRHNMKKSEVSTSEYNGVGASLRWPAVLISLMKHSLGILLHMRCWALNHWSGWWGKTQNCWGVLIYTKAHTMDQADKEEPIGKGHSFLKIQILLTLNIYTVACATHHLQNWGEWGRRVSVWGQPELHDGIMPQINTRKPEKQNEIPSSPPLSSSPGHSALKSTHWPAAYL